MAQEVAIEAPSLRAYLEGLAGSPADLRRVSRVTDPNRFEVTAVLQHLEDRGEFPAVLFDNPLNHHGKPSAFPLVTNLFATRESCARMLGLERTQVRQEPGLRFGELGQRPRPARVVGGDDAPAQAVVLRGDDVDLSMLPLVRHAEMDLGAVLTMALAMRAPDEPFYNVTFAKVFPKGSDRGGFTIHTRDMTRLLREWSRRGEPAPVVTVLGHHPTFWLGSLALTPYGTNEYDTIGAYMGQPLRLAPSVTWGSDFLVPADAEIVLEGEVVPGEQTVVNPFGEVSRQYQAQELAPVMRLRAITHRSDAIMQDVFSGHREHWLLGSIPREGSVLGHLRTLSDKVTAVHLPDSGCGRFLCYVATSDGSNGQAKRLALQALAHAPMFQGVVVVDDDIDVFREQDVLWAMSMYVDPDTDVDLIRNMPQSNDRRALGGGRVLIDATRPADAAFSTRMRVPDEAMAAVVLDDWLDPPHGTG